MADRLNILFEDQHLVAIDKPAGLLVHRSKVDVRARQFAMQMLRDQLGQLVYPVHRLDRPTSGVLLFALNSGVARSLCQQFENRSVSKQYEAIVRGHPPQNGCWDEPLVEKQDRVLAGHADEDKAAQSAVTRFETMQTWTIPFSTKACSPTGKYASSRYAHVRINPKTGRRHQIRRHFNHMAYPIVGDTTYGDRRHNRLINQLTGVKRLLLVAKTLTIQHPVSGQSLTIEANVGRQFANVVSFLDVPKPEICAATDLNC